jgi:4-hydroxybutyryl-CoA dehydratase/vinylacetyl-CoA-Delta-isomerase
MMRLLGQRTGACFQRCVGLDALNALYITTYDMDMKCGTDYHGRLKKYLLYVQKNDLMCAGAMTDVKGNRGLRPHQQADPDLYVHVVKKAEACWCGSLACSIRPHARVSSAHDPLSSCAL